MIALGGGKMNLLTLEPDPLALQLAHELDQVPERRAQPIKPPHCEHVAKSEHTLHPFRAGAERFAAAGRVLENMLTPRPIQGITLQIKILLCRRNPCISDPYFSTPLLQE